MKKKPEIDLKFLWKLIQKEWRVNHSIESFFMDDKRLDSHFNYFCRKDDFDYGVLDNAIIGLASILDIETKPGHVQNFGGEKRKRLIIKLRPEFHKYQTRIKKYINDKNEE
jgi:hypothetical protein